MLLGSRRAALSVSTSSSFSQRLITTVATPFPMRLVIARHSLMNRSMPTSKASDWMGIDGTAASVAARVTNHAPVTPVAPFDESMATSSSVICWPSVSGVFVAWARKIAAMVM